MSRATRAKSVSGVWGSWRAAMGRGSRRRRRGVERAARRLWVEPLEQRQLLTLTIDVGNHDLLPNTAGQKVDILVNSDDWDNDWVKGVDLRAEISGGGALNPVFQAVDFTFAGSMWNALPNTVTAGAMGGPSAEAQVAFNFSGDEIIPNGVLVQLVVDTTGFSGGAFGLSLRGLSSLPDTSFIVEAGAPPATMINNGQLFIGEANVPPVAVDDTYTTNEDIPLSAAAPGVLGNDSDANSNPLTAVLINTFGTGPGGALQGTLTFNPNGSFSYAPAADYHYQSIGEQGFTYRAFDGVSYSNPAMVVLNVTAVNDRPVADPQSVSVDEDSSVAITLTGVDSDPEVVQVLTYAIATPPTHGALSPIDQGTGAVTYTPFANYHGPDSFTFTVMDDAQAGAPASLTSLPATITIDVVSVSDVPDAVNDTATIAEDAPPTPINVLANDSIWPDVGEALTITGVTQGLNGGTVVIIGGGTALTYQPAPNYNGPDSFTYTINDGSAWGNDTATVNVTVTPVNDPPVVSPVADRTIAKNTISQPSSTGAIPFTVTEIPFELPPTHTVVPTSDNQWLVPDANIDVIHVGGADWTVTATPEIGRVGQALITLTVNDGGPGNNTTIETFLVQVVDPATNPIVGGDPGASNNFRVVRDASNNVEVWLNGAFDSEFALAGVDTLTIQGGVLDDTLEVDYSGGNPVPWNGLFFTANEPHASDTLLITNGTWAEVNYDYTNGHDGRVRLNGSRVNYSGVELIINRGSAANMAFNLPGQSDLPVLEDNGNTPGDNMLRLRSRNAVPSFTQTDFLVNSAVTVNLGPGNDNMAVSALPPAPHTVSLIDAGGTADTLDLSGLASAGVTIDLDTTAMQALSAGGPLLQLSGPFENFIATAGNDTVAVDPLVTAIRNLDGGPGTDTLNFDAQGRLVQDTGTVLQTQGFPDVNYQNFETGQTTGGTVRYLDDGDPGYAAGANFAAGAPMDRMPFGDDLDRAAANSGGPATWTFSDLARGVYLVSATWTKRDGNATNARYTIHDGAATTAPELSSVRVNQRTDPSNLTEAGSEWQHLAVVTVASPALTIALWTDANGILTADAVRVAPVETAWIVDNGDTYPDRFYARQGNLTVARGTTAGLFADVDVLPSGGSGQATWTVTGLTPGWYLVSATWTSSNLNATNAPFTVTGSGGAPVAVRVNQELPPAGLREYGVTWQNLTAVEVDAAGTITVRATAAGANNARVLADAIRVSFAPHLAVLDGGTELAPNATVNFGTTRLGENVQRPITIQNRGLAPLDLTSLTVVGNLLNSTSYPSGFSLAVPPGTTHLPPGASTTFVPQLNANAYGTYTGTTTLTSTDPRAASFRFSMTGVVAGSTAAPQIIDDGETGFSMTSFSSWTGQGFRRDVRQAIRTDTIPSLAQWEFTGLTAGDRYQVAATWSAHSNRATNAPFTLLGGAAAQAVPVNQKVAPNDFTADGGTWEILGEVVLTGTTLTVQLTDTGANGNVIADAIRILPLAPRVLDQVGEFAVVDNGDATYNCTNGSLWTGFAGAFEKDLQQLEGAVGTSEANWWVDVAPGIYQVGVSWTTHANRATNAPYTISTVVGPSTILQTATLNQRLTPQSNQNGLGVVQTNGTWFQLLTTTFVVPERGTRLNLQVTNNANGKVIADAMYVRRVDDLPSPLLAASVAPATAAAPAALSAPVLSAAIAEATRFWAEQGLTAQQRAALDSVQFVVADLPGQTLGLASARTQRVWVDVNGAGFGWHADGMDLTTVLAHELGHILGYGDLAAGSDQLMAATLPAAHDRVFAELGAQR